MASGNREVYDILSCTDVVLARKLYRFLGFLFMVVIHIVSFKVLSHICPTRVMITSLLQLGFLAFRVYLVCLVCLVCLSGKEFSCLLSEIIYTMHCISARVL